MAYCRYRDSLLNKFSQVPVHRPHLERNITFPSIGFRSLIGDSSTGLEDLRIIYKSTSRLHSLEELLDQAKTDLELNSSTIVVPFPKFIGPFEDSHTVLEVMENKGNGDPPEIPPNNSEDDQNRDQNEPQERQLPHPLGHDLMQAINAGLEDPMPSDKEAEPEPLVQNCLPVESLPPVPRRRQPFPFVAPRMQSLGRGGRRRPKSHGGQDANPGEPAHPRNIPNHGAIRRPSGPPVAIPMAHVPRREPFRGPVSAQNRQNQNVAQPIRLARFISAPPHPSALPHPGTFPHPSGVPHLSTLAHPSTTQYSSAAQLQNAPQYLSAPPLTTAARIYNIPCSTLAGGPEYYFTAASNAVLQAQPAASNTQPGNRVITKSILEQALANLSQSFPPPKKSQHHKTPKELLPKKSSSKKAQEPNPNQGVTARHYNEPSGQQSLGPYGQEDYSTDNEEVYGASSAPSGSSGVKEQEPQGGCKKKKHSKHKGKHNRKHRRSQRTARAEAAGSSVEPASRGPTERAPVSSGIEESANESSVKPPEEGTPGQAAETSDSANPTEEATKPDVKCPYEELLKLDGQQPIYNVIQKVVIQDELLERLQPRVITNLLNTHEDEWIQSYYTNYMKTQLENYINECEASKTSTLIPVNDPFYKIFLKHFRTQINLSRYLESDVFGLSRLQVFHILHDVGYTEPPYPRKLSTLEIFRQRKKLEFYQDAMNIPAAYKHLANTKLGPQYEEVHYNPDNANDLPVFDIWKHNLFEQFRKFVTALKDAKYIAVHTEYPGEVCFSLEPFACKAAGFYERTRLNVDSLKLMRVAFALFDKEGNYLSTYQFNLEFSLKHDMYSRRRINMLKEQKRVILDRHLYFGVPHYVFRDLLFESKMLRNRNHIWLAFNFSNEMAYFLHYASGKFLPPFYGDFVKLMLEFFPNFYDLKYILRKYRSFAKSLEACREILEFPFPATIHYTAGVAILTGKTFFHLKKTVFKDSPTELIPNVICGKLR